MRGQAPGGAEWIDALARAAREVIDVHEGSLVAVHNDWRADNIRLTDDGTGVAAVFDWDSLAIGREVNALGTVAAMHPIDWSGPADPYFATATECVEFVRAAVGHDDRRFGMRARLRADGAAVLT